VVIATQDPYEEVSGKGIKQLRKAGIEVVEGVLEEEAKELNIGFMKVHQQGLPWVTLKVATSLDGRIATQTGDSRWITNEKSRHYVHQLRAMHDGILTGIGTVLSDDPMLSCRLEEDVKQPVRIVLDSNLRISETSQLIKTAKEIPVWLVTSEEGKVGEAETITVPSLAGVIAIKPILEELAKRGITRLLVEAGSAVCTSFLRAGVVDQLVWCRAPIILGDKGMPVFQELAIDTIDEAIKLSPIERSFKGSDLIETYQFT
jgi:diaminohydroxyphosphoribosylaminopyrimidine deaminase/5-amino-6-(5-phosphoribosylamino)uracil reductase